MEILDTNVVSELRKVKTGKVHPNFAAWARTLRWSDFYLSAISVHEIEIGILRLQRYDLAQAEVLRTWSNKIFRKLESRILPVDKEVATHSARFLLDRSRPLEDALIAATAHVHRMRVITRNVYNFEGTDVAFMNPWADRN